jgi:hypothetical protein
VNEKVDSRLGSSARPKSPNPQIPKNPQIPLPPSRTLPESRPNPLRPPLLTRVRRHPASPPSSTSNAGQHRRPHLLSSESDGSGLVAQPPRPPDVLPLVPPLAPRVSGGPGRLLPAVAGRPSSSTFDGLTDLGPGHLLFSSSSPTQQPAPSTDGDGGRTLHVGLAFLCPGHLGIVSGGNSLLFF